MHKEIFLYCQLVITIFVGLTCVQAQFPKSNYAFIHSKTLVGPDVYRMSWNYTDTYVVVELQVKTNGWFGFGLTESGGMDGADVIVAWIDANGKTNFTDRHIKGRSVIIDKQQNWFLLSAIKANGYTSIVFKRDIQTCDPNGEDLDIEKGTPRVIFSWNNNLPSSDISNHGTNNRGIDSIAFITSLNEEVVFSAQDNIKIYNFTANATIPDGWETYYHCEMFKVPTEVLQTKHHLLRMVTQVPPGNEHVVHHWLLYYCDHSFEKDYLINNSYPFGGHCMDFTFTNSKNPPYTWLTIAGYCQVLGGIWASGGFTVQDFPKDLGFPYGGNESDFSYFYLQYHYNNPAKLSGIRDQTTLQLYFTQNLRKNDIGILHLSAASSWVGILIPPGQPSFSFNYSCRSDCLNKWTVSGDITIFASVPHTHLTGIQVYSKLIRNGKEISYISRAPNFDFNYQSYNYLQTPLIMKPNDELSLSCFYNTVNKDTYTYGGIGTPEEMCMDFLFYYPKKRDVAQCNLMYSFGGWWKLLKQLNATGNLKLNQSQPDYNSITNDLITSLKSNQYVTNQLLNFFSTANQTQTCIGSEPSDGVDYPQLHPKPIVEVDTCKNDSKKLSMLIISILFYVILAILRYQ